MQARPAHTCLARTDAMQARPAHTRLAKMDAMQARPAHTRLAKMDAMQAPSTRAHGRAAHVARTAHTCLARTDAMQARPSHTCLARTDALQARPAHTRLARTDAMQARPARAHMAAPGSAHRAGGGGAGGSAVKGRRAVVQSLAEVWVGVSHTTARHTTSCDELVDGCRRRAAIVTGGGRWVQEKGNKTYMEVQFIKEATEILILARQVAPCATAPPRATGGPLRHSPSSRDRWPLAPQPLLARQVAPCATAPPRATRNAPPFGQCPCPTPPQAPATAVPAATRHPLRPPATRHPPRAHG